MSESLNICLSCGFCCDGTMIGFVQLEDGEPSVLKELMEVEEVEDRGFFFLPCPNLGSQGCKIYPKRPKKCGEFECGLMKSIEKKEMDFDTALVVIHALKQKRINIERQFATLSFELKSCSFYFKILEIKKIFQKPNPGFSLSQKDLDLLSDIKDLDEFLSKNFGLSL